MPVQDEVVDGQPSGDFRYTTRRTEKHRMPSVTHEAVERIPIHAGGRHSRQELVKKKGGGLDLIRRLLSFGPVYHILGHSWPSLSVLNLDFEQVGRSVINSNSIAEEGPNVPLKR